ncbi:MAG: 50S ribosomal protein L24 [Microgenomates group bacterium GW2011_GWA2_39_19]|nr:MAG: 50S ribosomal protein L24 [Microgenomates group bacterium GW2011_GWA2_39_19]HBL51825.1 50S ribosomal protein L24 [Candidatus Blackburnbacteria bacterium]
MKLHIGDQIIVTVGKDKGRKGKVEKVFPETDKVRVAGLNVYKKHVKSYMGQKGGIVERFRPLPVSNVMLVCPECGKATRVGYRFDKIGSKDRICKACNAIIKIEKENKK